MKVSNNLLEQLKNPINFSGIEVRRQQLTFRLNRPSNTTYFRIHPDWFTQQAVLAVDGSAEIYLVKTDLVGALASFIKPKILFPYITREGVIGFWPVASPIGGRVHSATASALIAVEFAKTEWVRINYNRDSSSYEMLRPLEPIVGVDWPDRKIEEIAMAAFQNLFIEDMDHPIVKKILGRT